MAVVGYSQLHQIRWIKPPTVSSLLSVERLVGDPLLFVLVLAIVACAVVVSTRSASTGSASTRSASARADGGSRRSVHWPAGLLSLALPWLLPAAGDPADRLGDPPVYNFRYIVYCIPAAALLIGAALAVLGRYAGPVAPVVIVLGGLPSQLAERRADGHDVDIRRADHLVARQERPGDALLNISDQAGPRKATGERTLEGAYPYGLARLRDISAGASPQQSATLGGTYASGSGHPAAADPRHQALGRGMDHTQPGPGPGRPGLQADSQLGRHGPVASPLHHPGRALETPAQIP